MKHHLVSIFNYVLFALSITVIANLLISMSLSRVEDKLKHKQSQGSVYETGVIEKVRVNKEPENINIETEENAPGNMKSENDNKPHGYITIYPFQGGLGNHMFQLASLIGISKKNNLNMTLCDQDFLPDSVFDLSHMLQRSCNQDISLQNNFTETAHAKYSDVQLDFTQNWTLQGYFQSYKYFDFCKEDIKKVLQFKKEYIQMAKNFVQDIKVPTGSVKVGIHVRRGDFISADQRRLGRTAPDKGYIAKAMHMFQTVYKNITFIVMSDDRQWCKKNINGSDNVLYSPFHHEGPDLALASQCDHMIITVGTFSWWAGWMSGGQVTYYADYPKPGSFIDKTFAREDYYPIEWIPLV